MKNKETNVCPGCSRHCPLNAPRCKYGRACAAKINPAGRDASRHKHKWERFVTGQELAWQLLHVSRRAKKALCKRKLTQHQLLGCLSEGEKHILAQLLQKLDAQIG